MRDKYAILVGQNAWRCDFAITQGGQLGQLHPEEQLCASTTDTLGQVSWRQQLTG